MRRPRLRLPTACALLSLLTGCAGHEVDFQGEGAGVVGPCAQVQAVLETPPVGASG
ncbi:MAG TPA: phytase, partial [Brevundimonas sp.]|nr:phytase [Brevundimonas sp.]